MVDVGVNRKLHSILSSIFKPAKMAFVGLAARRCEPFMSSCRRSPLIVSRACGLIYM